MKDKICLLLVCSVLIGMISANTVTAASSVAVSPLTFELTANPGDVVENFLKVYNPNPDTVTTIEITVEDIAPTGEEGFVVVEPADTETYSLARWVNIEPKEFILRSGEEQVVRFTITVPQNAEPGGHYGSVVAAVKSSQGPQATGATIIPRVGSLVLLTVPGAAKEYLAVNSFSVDKHYFQSGPVKFIAKFENEGTVHVKPASLVTITDWRGRKVAVLNFPQRNVLPGQIRTFETSWDKKLLWGIKYTATLSGNYGTANNYIEPTVITFWAFPIKAGIGIILIAIVFILTRRRWAAAISILVKGERKK